MERNTNLPSCDTPNPFLQRIPTETWENQANLFCAWATNVAIATTPAMEEIRFLSTPDLQKLGCASNTAIQWTFAIWARELARQGELLTPSNPNAVSTAQQHTLLKGRIKFFGAAGGIERDFDIGAGVRFGLVATRASLLILAPRPWYRDPPTTQTASGIVLDTRVGASLSPAPCPPGRQLLTNTFTYTIDATVINTHVNVPSGAVRLSLYQTNAGALLAPFWRTMADIAAANIGDIILGADRRVEHLEIPGDAKVVCLNPAADQQERVVTLVWELEI